MRQLFEKLDYSKRDELSLKDFVREVNCQMHKNLRIRDLFRVYERLKPLSKDNFIRRLSKITL